MATKIFIIIILMVFTMHSFASVDCIWSSSGKGIYMEYVAACEQKNQFFIDSLLKKILSEINYRDTQTKIEIYINSESLFYYNTGNSNFIAVSYDRLGRMNSGAIFDYYWQKQEIDFSFNSENNPININYLKDTTKNSYGIKIIFNTDYRLGKPDWNNLKKIIRYCIDNASEIKAIQKFDTVGHCCNHYFVSLLTVDTTRINNILYPKLVKEIKNESSNTIVWRVLLLLTSIFLILFLVKKIRT